MDKPLVSVVILSWNRKEVLRETLAKLREDPYPNKEVLVVDAASSDGSPEMVESEFPRVRLIRIPDNQCVYALNVAFANAKGKYMLILDDDSYPLDNCIADSVAELEANPDLGCVSAQIVNPNGNIQWSEENKDVAHDTYCFIGCGAIVRSDLFKEVGYYPAEYFIFHNELTTSLKMLNKGYRIRYYPNIRCMHKAPPNARMTNKRLFYLVRNGSWNIWRFTPLKEMIYYYPGFILRNLYLGIKHNALPGVIKGFLASLGGLYRYLFAEREVCRAQVYLDRLHNRKSNLFK